MKIYVIYHATFENANAFYLTREAAVEAIKKTVLKRLESDAEGDDIDSDEVDMEEERWHIKEIEEGENFDADFKI